jgi:hypothetical protein
MLQRATKKLLPFTFIFKDEVANFSGTNKQISDFQTAVGHH